MALFKFGGKNREPAAPPSVETMRRRARQRLLGAAILVAAAVVGFPMVFDAAPRPVAVDVPIVVPDKTQMAPLPSLGSTTQLLPQSPSQPAASPAVAAAVNPAPASAAPASAPRPTLAQASAPGASAAPSPVATGSVAAQPPATAPAKPPAAPASQAARPVASPAINATPAPGAKASAPSQPTPAAKSLKLAALPATGRYVVQIGAFADQAKVREVRQKVERAGLKTYTQEVITDEGKRTRVRVGPLATKAEAERVAARLKALGLTGAVLFL